MPFTGELVHAAWLDWFRSAAPNVAAWLHEGNKPSLLSGADGFQTRLYGWQQATIYAYRQTVILARRGRA
jgi:hypothetical protein